MMRMATLCAVLFWAMLSFPGSVLAAIYTFVDENGTVHFTNVPNDPRYKPGIAGSSRGRRFAGGNPAVYEEYIRKAARIYAVDPLLIKAVIKAESNFDCRAVSRKGAKGLMQLMPETAADLNVCDPFDPQANILGGTSYLRQLLERFDGDLRLTLAAYNAGPTRVETTMQIPRIPETQQYVAKVLKHYRKMAEASPPDKRWVKVSY
ncbi:transglycosylase SLT domain-containing protein [Thiovibrio sp. JS02]